MTVGFGIFLIAVGAIILYALNVEIAGVEESTLGWILIVAGIVVAVLGLIAAPFRLWAERRRTDYATRDEYARGRNVLHSESYEIVSLAETGDIVACEVLWRGVLAVPLRSLKPGDPMKGRFAVFFQFRGDKIRRQRNYDCFDPF